jgi:hypothetical protein
VLRRVGVAWVLVGLLDMGVMVYCIAQRVPYSSGLNVLALFGGFLLLRGSLRAARFIRWQSAFLLTGGIGLLIALPLLQPLKLTELQLHDAVRSPSTIVALAFGLMALVLMGWTQREFQQAPPSDTGGRKRVISPAVVGVALVVVLVGVKLFVWNTETIKRAEREAAKQTGAGYQFHVRWIRRVTTPGASHVSGVVDAYTDHEAKSVAVEWAQP